MFARTLVRAAAAAALLLAGTEGAQPRASRSGTFTALDGHRARGGVRLQDAGGTATLALGRDFASERGPRGSARLEVGATA
jgi:hypothetical protein